MTFIQRKAAEKFSGCLKINSRAGDISVMETNGVSDIPLTPLDGGNYQILIDMVKQPDYTGTVILRFVDGVVTDYAYTKHYHKGVVTTANI